MKRVYPAMALGGVATTMLGPLLPSFAARGGWNDAQSGGLFVAEFLASVALAAAVGPLAARFGYMALIVAGLLLIAGGSAGCAIAATATLPLFIAVYGCGLGLMIPSANFAAAQVNRGSSAASVMWMNLAWSIGSVVAPLAIAALHGAFLWTLSAAALVITAVIASGPRLPPPEVRSAPVPGIHTLTIVAAALMFLYSGTENA